MFFSCGASSPSWRWSCCSSWKDFLLQSRFHSCPHCKHTLYILLISKSKQPVQPRVILCALNNQFGVLEGSWDELWQWTNWFGVASWKTEMFSLFYVSVFFSSCFRCSFGILLKVCWYSWVILCSRSASHFKSIQPFKKLKRSKRGNSNASGAQNGASPISQWFPIGSLPSLRLG